MFSYGRSLILNYLRFVACNVYMEMKIEELRKELLELREELVRVEHRLKKFEMGIPSYSIEEIN